MDKQNQGNNLLTIIFLIFFYPFGIPYMWVTKAFCKKTRWIVTLSFIGAIIIGLAAIIFMTTGPGYTM